MRLFHCDPFQIIWGVSNRPESVDASYGSGVRGKWSRVWLASTREEQAAAWCREEHFMRLHKLFVAAAVAAIGVSGSSFLLTPGVAIAGDATKAEKKEGYAKAKTDIVDTAVAAGSFNTLAAALKAADLVETLKGDGPFTVFAPTDEAFAKLPAGTVETLLKPENKDQLKSILTYHVVSGKVKAKDVVGMTSAKTVNGAELSIKVEGDKVMINNATVAKADVMVSNGVIHVIDTVLIPTPASASAAE
jgi:uncharacterized surface protein with fasciclin (FAS1) repeats